MSLDIAKLSDDLKRDEGLRLTVYADTTGNQTIGYGHKCSAEDLQWYGAGISQAQAESILIDDISIAVKSLDSGFAPWRGLRDDAQRGLANMAFNMGIAKLHGFKHMLSALERGDYDTAAAEALNSPWALQVGERSQRIAQLYRNCIEKEAA